jgi:hypothetical protein
MGDLLLKTGRLIIWLGLLALGILAGICLELEAVSIQELQTRNINFFKKSQEPLFKSDLWKV